MGQIDEFLPITAYSTLQPLAMTVGVLVLLIISIPWLAIGVPFAVIYLYRLRSVFRGQGGGFHGRMWTTDLLHHFCCVPLSHSRYATRSLRELKRFESVSRSPVYATFSSNLAGKAYWGVGLICYFLSWSSFELFHTL